MIAITGYGLALMILYGLSPVLFVIDLYLLGNYCEYRKYKTKGEPNTPLRQVQLVCILIFSSLLFLLLLAVLIGYANRQ